MLLAAIIKPVPYSLTISIPLNSTLLVGIAVGAAVGLIVGLTLTYLGGWLEERTGL